MEFYDGKPCSKCGEYKPFSEFDKKRTGRIGYVSQCHQCRNIWRRQHEKENPEFVRRRTQKWKQRLKEDEDLRKRQNISSLHNHRQRKYNCSTEAYAALLETQKGVCAICGKPETARNRSGEIRTLAVDHDHVTGEIRGLLCFRCNTKLAVLEDQEFVDAANAYLAKAKVEREDAS